MQERKRRVESAKFVCMMGKKRFSKSTGLDASILRYTETVSSQHHTVLICV